MNQHVRQRFYNNNNSKNSNSNNNNNKGKGLGAKYLDLVVPAGMPCQIHLRSDRNIFFTLTKLVTTKQLCKFTLTGWESRFLVFPHQQRVKIIKY